MKKIFVKRYGVTGLVFKIDATDGKKWVRFLAMQQKSATLIYDLRLLPTFAGALREKNRTRASFNKTPTNYIS